MARPENREPAVNGHYEIDGLRAGERTRYVLAARSVGDHRLELVAHGPTGTHAATADDLFEALQMVRREIEPHGWRLAVNGARRDTWPSGMLRDQLDGAVVYVLPSDPRQVPEKVPTFGPAKDDLLATVDEQEAAWEAWKALPR